MSPPWSRQELEDLRDLELFADDVDLTDEAVERLRLLPRAAVEDFFASGGELMPPPPLAPYQPPVCSIDADVSALAAALRAAGRVGLLELTGLPPMPFAELQAVFDDLHAAEGLSSWYPSGLTLKDAHATKPDATADMKRILDLNPKRLSEAETALLHYGATSQCSTASQAAVVAFGAVVAFWRQCADAVAPRLRAAVAAAAGTDSILEDDHLDVCSKLHAAAW